MSTWLNSLPSPISNSFWDFQDVIYMMWRKAIPIGKTHSCPRGLNSPPSPLPSDPVHLQTPSAAARIGRGQSTTILLPLFVGRACWGRGPSSSSPPPPPPPSSTWQKWYKYEYKSTQIWRCIKTNPSSTSASPFSKSHSNSKWWLSGCASESSSPPAKTNQIDMSRVR